MSTSGPGRGRDDLGRALLAQHPRGEQWRQLDVTIANLTFEQITRMGSLGEERASERQTVRDRIIGRITNLELAGRLASRWIRWKDTFGLPMPNELDDPIAVLHHPYLLARQAPPEHSGWHKVVLPVFDAGLAIAVAGHDDEGIADYELLTAPWQQTCLPSRYTATNAYGPHSQAALRVLRHAEATPARVVRRMGRACADIDEQRWEAACDAVTEASIAWGYPLRARCLYWETVPAAEDAAGESPTDISIVNALWGAAISQAFAERLDSDTSALLASPWRTAGLSLPG
ncbi:hypothetical protein [Umezawaea sp. Da 62-37]|uniref:hypothetical protein n=1 Tax=Umezawaea sp. Da 62-37 TaxID=3075927 RepID=UPI0028F6C959|nr:hypothetical protein [Umezawaea sp. Da 62-37]WNV90247.1 hypothetical protein RM788_18760 [Umezawaea sp. Da 62-37]